MITGPYFQTNFDGVPVKGFRTLQAAMAEAETLTEPTGEILFIPDDSKPVAYIQFRYTDGEIEPGSEELVAPDASAD